MTRSSLLNKLDLATTKAASDAIGRGIPIPISKKSTMIGNLCVEKNKNGFYDILTLDRKMLFENISVFDVAIVIAQRYNSDEFSIVKKVLYLEERYAKYHTDMVHYLHCLKSATRTHDVERMAILEDKFQVAESLAKNTRDQISIFKRVR